jgi:hypothetical protein
MAQKNDQPPASPTLIPALPSPIPPTTSSAATSEELSFFDRAKKSISNKNTFNEFLKLCNLFSQDLVDRTVLVHRARSFIGTNPELMKWFQDFIGYDEKDVIVENKARIPGGRVSLSNCRGLGPSYRLLPKRVRFILFLLFFFLLSRVSIVLGDVSDGRLGLDSTWTHFGLGMHREAIETRKSDKTTKGESIGLRIYWRSSAAKPPDNTAIVDWRNKTTVELAARDFRRPTTAQSTTSTWLHVTGAI